MKCRGPLSMLNLDYENLKARMKDHIDKETADLFMDVLLSGGRYTLKEAAALINSYRDASEAKKKKEELLFCNSFMMMQMDVSHREDCGETYLKVGLDSHTCTAVMVEDVFCTVYYKDKSATEKIELIKKVVGRAIEKYYNEKLK